MKHWIKTHSFGNCTSYLITLSSHLLDWQLWSQYQHWSPVHYNETIFKLILILGCQHILNSLRIYLHNSLPLYVCMYVFQSYSAPQQLNRMHRGASLQAAGERDHCISHGVADNSSKPDIISCYSKTSINITFPNTNLGCLPCMHFPYFLSMPSTSLAMNYLSLPSFCHYRNSRTNFWLTKILLDHTNSFLSSQILHKQQRAIFTSCFGRDLAICSLHLNISISSTSIPCTPSKIQHLLAFSQLKNTCLIVSSFPYL